MAGYWGSIVTSKDSKLTHRLCNIMQNLSENNIYTSPWLAKIKNILDECGMSNLYHQHNNINVNWLKSTIKRRLIDQFTQEWQTHIYERSMYTTYGSYKNELRFEEYLKNQPSLVQKAIVKFRCSNHSLPVEIGRHSGIDRSDRTCTLCNSNKLGDEYHFLLECINHDIVNLRKCYIPKQFYTRPSMYKFTQIMSNISCGSRSANQLGLFIMKGLRVVKTHTSRKRR